MREKEGVGENEGRKREGRNEGRKREGRALSHSVHACSGIEICMPHTMLGCCHNLLKLQFHQNGVN